jgi:hypothetical protein
MSIVVDDASSIPMNHRKGGKKPPDDSNGWSSSPTPHRSRHDKPQNHRRKEDYSLESHHRGHHKGPFTIKVTEYPIPCVFTKPLKLERYDRTTDSDEHVEHLDTVFDYHL